MKIINGKALLLKLRNPNRVTETIPKSKATGPHEVAVNWGVDEVHTLRSLGLKAPSPISGTIRLAWAIQALGPPEDHS
jgi:hypothetical protein